MMVKDCVKRLDKRETAYLAVTALLSGLVRFWGLGYSNFYGDETKTFYLNKTVPAAQFLLNQRKGPLQFVVAWFMEKLTGGYDELWTRLPYALAGFLSVFAFYFLVRKLFGRMSAAISTLFFAFSGFFVAYSRTIQYQSFLTLFGLAAIWFFITALQDKKRLYLVISGLLFGISFLFHYDAVFYLLAALGIYLYISERKTYSIKDYLLYFAAPLLIIVSIFFVPYILGGYFSDKTVGYLSRRVSGKEYLPNNSLYTFLVYNPLLLSILPLIAGAAAFFMKFDWRVKTVFIWFFIPFVLFQFVFLNPGTHINNYMIPLYILSGYSIIYVYNLIQAPVLRRMYLAIVLLVATVLLLQSFLVYAPVLSKGYPWKNASYGPLTFFRIEKKYNLFLYGFPYNRGWKEISAWLATQKGVRNVYTNDNDTIAQYYLLRYDYTPAGSNYLPQYYIKVMSNQEFRDDDLLIATYLGTNYTAVHTITLEGKVTSVIYKRNY